MVGPVQLSSYLMAGATLDRDRHTELPDKGMLGEEFVMAGTMAFGSYLLGGGYTGQKIVTLSNLTKGCWGKNL